MRQRVYPVFFDTRGRRARVTNALLAMLSVVFAAVFYIAALGILTSPQLPIPTAPAGPGGRQLSAAELSLSRVKDLPRTPRGKRVVPDSARVAKRFAIYDVDDSAS